MGEKRFAREPLLYIQQTVIQTPVAPMQHDYYTPKNINAQKENHKKNVHKRTVRRYHAAGEWEQHHDTEYMLEENVGEEQGDIEKDGSIDSISFKEMTLQQKVDYFISKPSHAPTVKCELKTEEKAYRGVITDLKDDQVLIRVGRKASSTKIPFDEIQSIRMLGF